MPPACLPAGALLNSIDTGSQVCSLQWNRHERELLSSHGFRWARAAGRAAAAHSCTLRQLAATSPPARLPPSLTPCVPALAPLPRPRSQNQLCLWKYPSMAKVAELTGHTSRVLHLAQSPDGTTVVSAAADETLRFWRCFGEPAGAAPKGGAKPGAAAGSLLRSVNIR